ncbi:tyrosine-type recombinase/integrase [Chlamydiota bacterium]
MNYFEKQIHDFIESLKLRHYAADTIRSYYQHIELFLRWVVLKNIYDLREITEGHIKEYQSHLRKQPITPHTIHIKLRSIKRFFEYLEASNTLLYNPATKIIYPQLGERLPTNVLTHDEIKRLLKTPNTGTATGIRNMAMLELLYSTGLRREECVSVDCGDVDYEGGYVRVTRGKGRKDRIVPVGTKACMRIKDYIEKIRPRYAEKDPEERALFLSIKGNRLTSKMLGYILQILAKKAHITKTVTAHTIRRTVATHLLENDTHPLYIQRLLGHERLDTLRRYIKIAGTDVKKTHKKTHPREKDRQ